MKRIERAKVGKSRIRPVATWKDGDCCLSESCWGWWWCTHVCRAKHLCPGPPLQSTMASGSMGGEDSHLYHPASVNLRSSYADASKYTNTKVKFRYLYIANWCEGKKWCPVVTWCQHTDTNCHFSSRLIKLGGP